MMLRMRLHHWPTALLCWAALGRKRSRGWSLRVGTVKRVGWMESVGCIVTLHRAVDSVRISPGHDLQRSPQGFTEMCFEDCDVMV